MADKYIRQLTEATGLTGAERLVLDVGSGAAQQATISDVVAASNLGAGVHNVLDYGASPTASAATNTAAIQAAINATSHGGIVFIPAGAYNVTGSLSAVTYPGNSAQLKTVYVQGAGNSVFTDIYGAHHHATSLLATAQADTPVFALDHTRGVRLMDLNILGDDSSVTDACAVWFKTANTDGLLERVTIGGWAEGVRVGTAGQTGANDDFLTLRNVRFHDVTTCIRNYSNSSYGMRLEDSYVDIDCGTVYKTSDQDGAVMNSIKIVRCALGQTGAVIAYNLSAPCNAYDVAVIEQCVMEGLNVAPVLFTQNTGDYHNNGLVIRDNVINGSDVADLYDTGHAHALVTYYGRGPFLFQDNRVDCVRPVFVLDTRDGGGGVGGASTSISHNNFSNRPVIIFPVTTPYPAIHEADNFWYYETSQTIGGGLNACVTGGRHGVLFGGRYTAAIEDIQAGNTYRAGSRWTIGALDDRTGLASSCYVAISGTPGTISGVTATLTSGDNYATLTAGSAAEKAKIFGGAWITIGAANNLQVWDVIGNTVYLHATWGGATQTTQAVSYAAPLVHREFYVNNSPPSGTWGGGDVAWNYSAAGGGSPGWVYQSGVGWKAMGNLAA